MNQYKQNGQLMPPTQIKGVDDYGLEILARMLACANGDDL